MTSSNSKRSHVLFTLGILFTIGGATRFLPNALARAESTITASPAQQSPTPVTHAEKDAAPHIAVKSPQQDDSQQVCFTGEMATSLLEDRALIEQEMEALRVEKLSALALQSEIETQTAELSSLQLVLEERWQQMQQSADEDIRHLAKMYGTMKPDQAALIFDKMDPGFAAGFLRQLSSDQAGLILANMETGKAYIVSVRLASMNSDVRTEAPN